MNQDPEVQIAEEFRLADTVRRIVEAQKTADAVALRAEISALIHKAIAPDWMVVAGAMVTQEHYEEFLDRIAVAVIDRFSSEV